jgi:ABC-type multidrug transport system fused ATPase/permease subunit
MARVARTAAGASRLVVGKAPRLSLAILVTSLGTSFVSPAAARVGGRIIDAVQATSRDGHPAGPIRLIAAEAGLGLALMAMTQARGEMEARVRDALDHSVTRRVLEKAQSLALLQLDTPDMRDRLSRTRCAGVQAASAMRTVISLVQGVVTLGVYFAAGAHVSLAWVLPLVVVAALRFVIAARESARRHERGKKRTPMYREASYLERLTSDPSAALEMKILGTGPLLVHRWHTTSNAVVEDARADSLRGALLGTASSLVSTSVLYGLYAAFAVSAARGGMSLGELTYAVAAVRATESGFQGILSDVRNLYGSQLELEELWGLLATTSTEPGGRAVRGTRPGDGLRLEHVGFSYLGALAPVLTDVSVHVPPGSRILLAGDNGSGKSTLMMLFAGLYAPTSGRVLLDGVDLFDWDRDALRRRLAILQQQFVRYELTARENVSLGDTRRESDAESLGSAVRRGLAEDVVARLPQGLETRLGREFNGGHQLSGGQWQRVALSRLFFRQDADILLLDEPTASMDPRAEAKVVDALGSLREDAIVVLVSHRAAIASAARRLIVLERGRVVEDYMMGWRRREQAAMPRGEHKDDGTT